MFNKSNDISIVKKGAHAKTNKNTGRTFAQSFSRSLVTVGFPVYVCLYMLLPI